MSLNINKVIIAGNLTRDPELRFIPSGQGVCNFTIATNRTYNSKDGEKKEEVTFLRVVAWGKLAEICNEYLKKGSSAYVEGRLQVRIWESEDGSKRTATDVLANNVQFLGKPKSDSKPQESVDHELQPDEEIPF